MPSRPLKIRRHKESYMVILPKDVLVQAGLSVGNWVVLIPGDKKITIKKLEGVNNAKS